MEIQRTMLTNCPDNVQVGHRLSYHLLISCCTIPDVFPIDRQDMQFMIYLISLILPELDGVS